MHSTDAYLKYPVFVLKLPEYLSSDCQKHLKKIFSSLRCSLRCLLKKRGLADEYFLVEALEALSQAILSKLEGNPTERVEAILLATKRKELQNILSDYVLCYREPLTDVERASAPMADHRTLAEAIRTLILREQPPCQIISRFEDLNALATNLRPKYRGGLVVKGLYKRDIATIYL